MLSYLNYFSYTFKLKTIGTNITLFLKTKKDVINSYLKYFSYTFKLITEFFCYVK